MRTIRSNNRISPPRSRLHLGYRPGAVMVEMAITSSLAFLFFFAALEFCRVAMIRHTVENALYEGARTGIVPGATSAEVGAKARVILQRIGISGATIDVLPAVLENSTRDVSVRIRLPLDRGLLRQLVSFSESPWIERS